MNIIKIITLLIFISFGLNISAQNKYWIFFKDKQNSNFNPYNYFDKKAIDRRIKNNISLYDYTDLPVNEDYLSAISNYVDSISVVTRWFNGVSVYATSSELEKIKNLSFVKEIEKIESSSVVCSVKENFGNIDDMPILARQINLLKGQYFHNNGINGKGIRIAVFDAGFPCVDVHEAFEHIRANNRIIKTWDFTKNKEYVYDYNSHGTMVLSCIAGIYDSLPMGLATEAEFLLARTEVNTEIKKEEDYWLAAMEWADKNGADIINSSLGYTFHRYFTEQMDGKTSLVTRAANLAAKKGMLVVNAIGNEGDTKWRIMGAPADADSVLSIGGIGNLDETRISFSSYGPTYTKKLKPNVCASGNAFVASKYNYGTAMGTSFASPLIAGFAACAWQTDTSLTNMELFHKIEQSASLYPYFDYAHGYGIPQADYFTNKNLPSEIEKTFEIKINDSVLNVIINEPLVSDKNLLYYHIADKNNVIKEYYVIQVFNKNVLQINLNDFNKNDIIRIHFDGYTWDKEINKILN